MSNQHTMDITVQCFASAREILARRSFQMTVAEGTTIGMLEKEIRSMSSQLAELPFMLALNMSYPSRETVVREGDEVAIIPPVSGG
ncbi:molybdopterin synthase sulfur carrier subunit [Prosthecochloris sp. ZM]|nr:molybdopterin synthase sulfur carrier subunit [Prosthecochloris sp. ZM]